MDHLVYAGLGLSVALNVGLCAFFAKRKRILSVDARELLHDLTSGRAVVDVKVIDTAGLFLRSPRG
jgi:hypothetical protein